MSQAIRNPNAQSEYHKTIEEVLEGCRLDGLIYANEMMMVHRAYQYQRAKMNGDQTTMRSIELPGRSGENMNPTPGVQLLENVMSYKTQSVPRGMTIKAANEALKKAKLIDDQGSFIINSGELPQIPGSVRTVRGPSVEQLRALPFDSFIEIKPGVIGLEAIKRRLRKYTNTQTTGKSKLNLVCWKKEDGTIIVRHG